MFAENNRTEIADESHRYPGICLIREHDREFCTPIPPPTTKANVAILIGWTIGSTTRRSSGVRLCDHRVHFVCPSI